MAIARTLALALAGVDGQVVEVEADLSAGLPGLTFTGLADAAVVEARDRIRAAVLNSGAVWPNRRITLALLPADVRKVGSRFDLAMALAVLAAAGSVPPASIAAAAWIAELGLDGRLRPIRGVLPAVIAAKRAGIPHVVVAAGNAAEAALVTGVDVRAAQTLAEVITWLCGNGPPPAVAVPGVDVPVDAGPDLAEVAGQGAARRALEVSAAGAHHLYLVGPPGAGKTMLAERLPGLLPELDDSAALAVTAVHSVAGALPKHGQLLRRAPFQAPHRVGRRAGRWWVGHCRSGCHLVGASGRSIPRRGAGVQLECPQRSSTAARERRGRPASQQRGGDLSGAIPARAGGQSVPLRQPGARMLVPAGAAQALSAATVRAAPRPDRHPAVGRPGAACGVARRVLAARADCRGRRPGQRGASGGPRAMARARVAHERRGVRAAAPAAAVALAACCCRVG